MRSAIISVFSPIVGVLLLLSAAPQVASARIVFDPTDYAQNLLQAAGALEQIHNQIASLQNEAQMLENMAKELTPLGHSSLDALVSALQRIDSLMQRAEGVSFDAAVTRDALARYYTQEPVADPQTAELVKAADARWRQALGAYRNSLALQAEIVANMIEDQAVLPVLVDQSQAAVGSLQATQVGNQLLALSTKQQLQIQNLLAAQFRAEALEEARQAKAEEAARATSRQFLGSGSAYTPH